MKKNLDWKVERRISGNMSRPAQCIWKATNTAGKTVYAVTSALKDGIVRKPSGMFQYPSLKEAIELAECDPVAND